MSSSLLTFFRGDQPQRFRHLLSWPFSWISYFLIDKAHSHYVFVFSMHEVLIDVFSIFIQCVHLDPSIKSPLFNHHFFHLWDSFRVSVQELRPSCWLRVANAPTYGVALGSIIQKPFIQLGHESQVHAKEIWLPHSWTGHFFCTHHHPNLTYQTFKFFVLNSIPNPFPLIAILLFIPTTNS
jgi:hypothetical protein